MPRNGTHRATPMKAMSAIGTTNHARVESFLKPTQTSQATGAESSTPEISAQSGIDSPRLKEMQPNATLTTISSAELRARAYTPVCWVHFHKAVTIIASHGR